MSATAPLQQTGSAGRQAFPGAPGIEVCPLCGGALERRQDWCLRCGAAARTRLAASPNWRAPVIVLALLAALSLAVIAAALVKLAGDSGSGTASSSTRRTPAAATAPPAATAPAGVPAPSAPGAATGGRGLPGTGAAGSASGGTGGTAATSTSTPAPAPATRTGAQTVPGTASKPSGGQSAGAPPASR